jgi:hypothetical protein
MTMMVRAAAGGGDVLVVGLVRASTSILTDFPDYRTIQIETSQIECFLDL